jgi:hypothetical protein
LGMIESAWTAIVRWAARWFRKPSISTDQAFSRRSTEEAVFS